MNGLNFKQVESIKTSSTKPLVKALFVSMTLTLVIFVVFSIIIAFSSISEASADTMVTVATAIAIAVSGFTAARGASSKGWMWGSFGGILYILAVWIIGMLANDTFSFSTRTLVAFIIAAIIGAFGGIVGINSKK